MMQDRHGDNYFRLTRKQVYNGMSCVPNQAPGPGGVGEAKVHDAADSGASTSRGLAVVPETGRGAGATTGRATGRATGASETGIPGGGATGQAMGRATGWGGANATGRGSAGVDASGVSARGAGESVADEKARLVAEVRRVERQLERLEASLEAPAGQAPAALSSRRCAPGSARGAGER